MSKALYPFLLIYKFCTFFNILQYTKIPKIKDGFAKYLL